MKLLLLSCLLANIMLGSHGASIKDKLDYLEKETIGTSIEEKLERLEKEVNQLQGLTQVRHLSFRKMSWTAVT